MWDLICFPGKFTSFLFLLLGVFFLRPTSSDVNQGRILQVCDLVINEDGSFFQLFFSCSPLPCGNGIYCCAYIYHMFEKRVDFNKTPTKNGNVCPDMFPGFLGFSVVFGAPKLATRPGVIR